MEEAEAARLERYLKESELRSAAEEARRKEKIKNDAADVKATLDAQMQAKRAAQLAEQEASRMQYETIKKEVREDAERSKREAEERLHARRKQDEILVAQMTLNTLSTADDVMNRDGKNREAVVNRGILRLMKQEGVELETVTKFI